MSEPFLAAFFRMEKMTSCLRVRARFSRPISRAISSSSPMGFCFSSDRFIGSITFPERLVVCGPQLGRLSFRCFRKNCADEGSDDKGSAKLDWNVPPTIGACLGPVTPSGRRCGTAAMAADGAAPRRARGVLSERAVEESGQLRLGQGAHFGGFHAAI